MLADNETFRDQLTAMDVQLSSMIAIADAYADHLLGALLCDVHACVASRRVELAEG